MGASAGAMVFLGVALRDPVRAQRCAALRNHLRNSSHVTAVLYSICQIHCATVRNRYVSRW